jgi:MFS family permease
VIATIVVRLFSGSLSDRIGRRETLIIGVTLLIVSMFLIGYAKNTTDYLISALLFGVATGVTSPTIFAWTADLSDINRRGVGAGTMFIALEFGIMAGSLSTLLVYENSLESITNGFLIGVAFAFAALIFLIVHLIRFR